MKYNPYNSVDAFEKMIAKLIREKYKKCYEIKSNEK